MMTNIARLERRTEYFLLLLTYGLLILPPVTCQSCNSQYGEPLIKISSTPSAQELPTGAAVNLTCKAWQTDDLAMGYRPYKIYWYDPKYKRVGERCQAASPAAKEMSCPLMVGPLTKEKCGTYTCKAVNRKHCCSNKIFEISLLDSNFTVHCGNQYMTVAIAKSFLPAVDRGHLQLLDASCTATETSTQFILQAPLVGCFSSVSHRPKSVLYSNKVLTISSDINPVVTRKKEIEIPFSCLYAKSGVVSTAGWKPEKNVIKFSVERQGNFTMTLDMFPNSDFGAPYSQKDLPLAVHIEQSLFFEVSVTTGDGELSIRADRCYATLTQDRKRKTSVKYDLIQNGCPTDPSVQFLPTNSSTAQRFKLDAFQFTGKQGYVFVHCHVIICDENDPLSDCNKSCPIPSGRLTKREVRDHLIDEYALVQGPVHLVRRKRDTDGKELSYQKCSSVASMVVLGLVSAIFLTGAVFILARKSRDRLKQSMPLVDKESTVMQ